MNTEPTGQPTVFAPRLPSPGAPQRRSLRPTELASLSPDERAAVDQLLALAPLDDD